MEVSEWDERAPGYDKLIHRIFPDYEVLHRLVALCLARLEPGSGVLVVGAGTGKEAASFAAQGLSVTAQDLSSGMIEVGQALHAELPIDWQAVPVSELPLAKYDAATLILVLHFLPDDDSEEGKLALLKEISKRLKPGAPFVYADLMPDPESYETHVDLWKQYGYSFGADERLEGSFEYLTTEIPVTTPDRNEELLDEAGFEEPVTLFQQFWLRLMVTRRS